MRAGKTGIHGVPICGKGGRVMLAALGLINYGMILIFGVLLSFEFAGIEKTAKNRRTEIFLICAMLLIQVSSWQLLGLETTKKIYPFIVHFPLIFSLVYFFKSKWLIAFISVVSAYLCCQTPRWIATVALYIFDSRAVYHIVNTLAIFLTLYFLKKYVISSVNRLMNISKRSLLLFGAVPLMYYLFDYGTTVYTNLLYNGIEMAVHFMPSVVSMFYFVFAIIYYNEMQRRSNAERESMLMSIQINQAKKDFASFQELQEKTAIYRHDMRHHLSLIGGYLLEGNAQKAIEYISQTQADIDSITPSHFCNNSAVNLILSSFVTKAKATGVKLSVDANVAQSMDISDTDICTLLSNGLENAINAAAQVEDNQFRTVRINCQMHKENLLILIENRFAGEVIMKNGLPLSQQQGHGFGVKSIEMITKKYNGYYSFAAKNELFILKIVLPLKSIL